MSLPAAWVDELFARLSVRYGAAFLRQWEGLDIDKVKADWRKVLAFFADQPAALSAALDELPRDFPPNAMQLRDAALRHAKPREAPRLPPAVATPEQVEAGRKACQAAAALGKPIIGTRWAEALKAREEGGERLTLAQRQAWRDALGVSREEEAA